MDIDEVDNNLSLIENGSNNNNNKEEPSLQDEIINFHASEGSDIEIVAVSKSVAEGRTKKKLKEFIRSRRRTKIYINSVNSNSVRNQDSYIKEEIIISDASDSDGSNRNELKTFITPINRRSLKTLQKTSKRKVHDQNESLSSIILNCPRCNVTKSVFSTSLGNITCKECKVNMTYVCNKCNLRYPTMIALYRHKKLQCVSKGKRKILQPKNMFILKCTKCNLSQKIRRVKLSRCLTCRIDMPYECMVCSKTFNTYSNLYSHIKHRCQLKRRTYYCNECNYKCTNELALVRHLQKSHPKLFACDSIVKCCICDQNFEDSIHLKRHEVVCGASFYQCKFCPYKPKYQENLKKHLLSQHTDEVCNENIEDILRQSVYRLTKVVKQPLSTTPKHPKSGNHSREIVKRISKIVYCPKCNKESVYQKGFRFCSTCKSNYRYRCSECTGMYQGLPSLYRHIHRQHGKMDYECNNCGRYFSFFGDMNEHSKTCGQAPRFECEICFFKTRYKYNLRNHMLKLHDENRQNLVCEDCGAQYKTERTMKKHMEKCGNRIIRMSLEVEIRT